MTEYLFEVEPNAKHLTGIWIEAPNQREAALRAVGVCAGQGYRLNGFIPKRIGMELNPMWVEALSKENDGNARPNNG